MHTAPFWLLVAILVIGSWALQYFDISANACEHSVDEDDKLAQDMYRANRAVYEKMNYVDEPAFEGSAEEESPADIQQEEYLPYDQHEDRPHWHYVHKREADYPEYADEEYPPGLFDEAEEHDYFLDASSASPYSHMAASAFCPGVYSSP